MYRGNVKWFIADLKPSFQESKNWSTGSALTEANYKTVLEGLKNNAKVNGIRLPIFTTEPKPDTYSTIYKDVFNYARKIGLAIYASPLSTGTGSYVGWSDQQYTKWLADYANYYRPDFLSPFNEADMEDKRMIGIVSLLRPELKEHILIVGPDTEQVHAAITHLQKNPPLANIFDIISSHNASKDHSATTENWTRLVSMKGIQKPFWSSEDPRGWDTADQIPGISSAIDGGVQGLVIWMAKPSLIDDAGHPTPKALEIVSHIVSQ